MNCKYKSFSNERFCQAIWGKCQFVKCRYGEECPIYWAFKDLDRFWAEAQAAQNGGTASFDQVMAADMYDETARAAECDTLDLDFD